MIQPPLVQSQPPDDGLPQAWIPESSEQGRDAEHRAEGESKVCQFSRTLSSSARKLGKYPLAMNFPETRPSASTLSMRNE